MVRGQREQPAPTGRPGRRRLLDRSQKLGVDADKATLEIMRVRAPAYFFDRAKGLVAARTLLTEGMLHAKVGELLWEDMMKGYDWPVPVSVASIVPS